MAHLEATETLFRQKERIAKLCKSYGVAELSVFGSALRDDFRADSDVDFLVTFEDGDYGPWMNKLTQLEAELSRLLDRPVEVVPKEDLKWVIRDRVLAESKVLYDSKE